MTTLYWGPHTCAIGIHILLEELGAPYDTIKLDVQGGETHKPPFSAINPKGKVPTLVRDDGAIVTEYATIARYLQARHPEAGWAPQDPEAALRAEEMMDYAVATVHGQGFGRLFMPAKFEPDDVLHSTLKLGAANVKHQGREMVEKGFAILANALGDRHYAGGEHFGIADTALFYVERWAPQEGITLPPALQAHLGRMQARPAVRRVLEVWSEPTD